ncbi:hypothetical protein D3C76_1262310 [compost metagenome]
MISSFGRQAKSALTNVSPPDRYPCGNDQLNNGLKLRCQLLKDSQYVKSLLALLSLLALPALAAEPTLYGRYEYISLPEIGGEVLKAKMDTGALTASLSAKDIETFTRDGEDWVRFRLATKDASNKVYEHKVARISKIKTRSEEDEDEDVAAPTKRPVVDLELCLGDVKRTVEVNLTDRSSFNYPLLIGAKALREFGAAVNPARRFTADKPEC